MIEVALKKPPPYRVLCLGAHADDIEIGCGGTILKLIEDYRSEMSVHWVVLSATAERRGEAKSSAEAFLRDAAQTTIIIEDFEDSFFPYHGAEIKKRMHQVSREFVPDVIFTHHRQDLHQDHRLVSELTWNAFRDHWILEYEVPKFDGDLMSPNLFVSLSQATCRKKVNYLLEYFQSQKQRSWFTAETFSALHRLRGVECNSKTGYAEAFHCRKIVLG
jgi:LmbE family N-acetylglucosaminyl deacetylase